MPHPDYALMLWCGRLPVLNYAGGIVISRHRYDIIMQVKVNLTVEKSSPQLHRGTVQ